MDEMFGKLKSPVICQDLYLPPHFVWNLFKKKKKAENSANEIWSYSDEIFTFSSHVYDY